MQLLLITNFPHFLFVADMFKIPPVLFFFSFFWLRFVDITLKIVLFLVLSCVNVLEFLAGGGVKETFFSPHTFRDKIV